MPGNFTGHLFHKAISMVKLPCYECLQIIQNKIKFTRLCISG